MALIIAPCVYESVAEFENKRVKHRGSDYEARKEAWMKLMLDILYQEFPQLQSKVIYQDLGTALTNDFYLGTHRGAVYGLAHTPERFANPLDPKVRGLRNLYLSGQDVVAAGIVGALTAGFLTAGTIAPTTFLNTAPLFRV